MKRFLLITGLAIGAVGAVASMFLLGASPPGGGMTAPGSPYPLSSGQIAGPTFGAPIATYWVDCVSGSDGNSGTASNSPFQHIQTALDAIPLIVRDKYLINVAAGTCPETVMDNHLYAAGRFLRSQILIFGNGTPITPTLGSGGSTSGTLGTDPVFPSITYTATIGANWNANELLGMFLQVTSGALSGQLFPIAANTTNTIDVAILSAAGGSGATFSIVQLANTITNSPASFDSVTVANTGSNDEDLDGLIVQRFNLAATHAVVVASGVVDLLECSSTTNPPEVRVLGVNSQVIADHSYFVGGAQGALWAAENFDTLSLGGTVINGGAFGILLGSGGSLITDVSGGLIIQGTTTAAINARANAKAAPNYNGQSGNTYLRNGTGVGLDITSGWSGALTGWAITGNTSHGILVDGSGPISGLNTIDLSGAQVNSNGGDGIRVESAFNIINLQSGTNTVSSNTGTGINFIQHGANFVAASHNAAFIGTGTTMSGNGHDVSVDGSTFLTLAALKALSGAFTNDTSGLENRISAGAVTVGNGYRIAGPFTTTATSIPASSGCTDTAETVTGATVDKACSVAPHSNPASAGGWSANCYASAAGTLQLHLCCVTATCTAISVTWTLQQ